MKYDNFKNADEMQDFIDGMEPIFREANKTTNIHIADENGNILFDEHGLTKRGRKILDENSVEFHKRYDDNL